MLTICSERCRSRERLDRHRCVEAWSMAVPRGAVEIWQVDRPLHLHRPAPEDVWGEIQGTRYGFWANVNPRCCIRAGVSPRRRRSAVRPRCGPRCSMGYGEFVADLYKGLESEPLLT